MAVIGKLHSLSYLFEKTVELESLYIYLNNSLKSNHLINNRILATKTGTENKFELEAGMFCIEQSYSLKSPNQAFYESHKEYIDFQLMVSGVEFFEIGDYADFQVKIPYSEEKDLIIYEKSPNTSKIRLYQGMLAIFFQSDVHAGGLYDDDVPQGDVFKTVVKVPKKLIKFKL